MSNLTAGARVILKSGGPIMTISWIDGDRAYCQWFAGQKLEASNFSLISLELAPKETEPLTLTLD